jgi:hypothetical protein
MQPLPARLAEGAKQLADLIGAWASGGRPVDAPPHLHEEDHLGDVQRALPGTAGVQVLYLSPYLVEDSEAEMRIMATPVLAAIKRESMEDRLFQ